MSGTDTFPLSGEDRQLLSDNGGFFQPIVEVYQAILEKDKAELMLRGQDSDARIEKTTLPNGDVEVVFVYGIDTNEKLDDGRIELKDKFVFDSKEKLKDFQRQYKHNGQGNPKQWQEWLAQYEKNNPKPPQDKLQKFASQLVRRYAGNATWRSFSDPFMEALKSQADYLMKAIGPIQVLDENLAVKFGDPQSHYTIEYKGEETVLTLSFVVDDDEDPANKRFFWNEKITFDHKTQKYKTIERKFTVAPESQELLDLEEQVKKLNVSAGPTDMDARPFFEALLPRLPLLNDKNFASAMDKGSVGYRKLPGFDSMAERISRRSSNLKHIRNSSTQAGLQVMEQVALEQLQKRYDASRGLLSQIWSDKVDLAGEQARLRAVFEKAAEKLKGDVANSPLEVLAGLDLGAEEKKVVGRIAADRLAQEVNAIAQEYDPNIRAFEYMRLAREHLMMDEGLGASALYVVAKVKDNPKVQKDAGQLIALAEGKASNGTKIEFLANHFVDEAASPTMIGAMMIAPFAGGAAEFGLLKLMGKNSVGRFFASQIGLGFEAASFSGSHRFLASLSENPELAWKDFGLKEIGSAYLLFNGMRFAHGAMGLAEKGLAKTTRFGQDLPMGEMPGYPVTPNGRMITTFGPLPRELNAWGRTLSFLGQHAGGIGAMWGIEHFAGQGKNHSQGGAGELFDALMMYFHANIGMHIGNRMSGGKFQANLGEFRLRLENFKNQAASPLKVKAVPPSKAPLASAPQPAPAAALRVLPAAGVNAEGTSAEMFPARPDSTPPRPEPTQIRRLTEDDLEPVSDPDISPLPIELRIKRLPYKLSLLGFESTILELEPTANTKRILFGRSVNEPSGLRELGEVIQVNVSTANPTVSEFHAEIAKGPDGVWYLGDSSSAYGSFLNGTKLKSGRAFPLNPGDQVRFGESVHFTFDIQGPVSPELKEVLSLQSRTSVLHRASPDQIAPVTILEYPLQSKPPSPEAAESFPFEKVFPDFHSTPDKDYIVSWLMDGGGNRALKYTSDQTSWPLMLEAKRGQVPVGCLLIDARGRWVWQNLRGEKGPLVNGEVVQQWVFLEEGSTLDWGQGTHTFQVSKPKRPKAREAQAEPKTVVTDPDEELLERSRQPEQNPGESARSDLSKTLTGIPVPNIAMLIDRIPPELTRGLPEGQGPINLRQIIGGKMQVITDPKAHTFYIKDGEVQELAIDTTASNDAHARIYYGDLRGEKGWWLLNNMSGYPITLSGKEAVVHQSQRLRFGDVIVFGDSRGNKEVLRIVFEKPATVAEKPSTATMQVYSGAPRPNLGEILSAAPAGASEFPRAKLVGYDPNRPPMSLRLGPKREMADWHTTHYILGAEPNVSEMPSHTRAFPIGGSNKVAADHAAVFIDEAGQWWLLDLKPPHGTYLNSNRLAPGEAKMLLDGDKIGLGGTENLESPNGHDSSRVILFELPKQSAGKAEPSNNGGPKSDPPPPAKGTEPEPNHEFDFGELNDEASAAPGAPRSERPTVQLRPSDLPAFPLEDPGAPVPPPRVRPVTDLPPPPDPGEASGKEVPDFESEVVTRVGELPIPAEAYPTGIHEAPTARPPPGVEIPSEAPEPNLRSPPPPKLDLPSASIPLGKRPRIVQKGSGPRLPSPPPPPAIPARMRSPSVPPPPHRSGRPTFAGESDLPLVPPRAAVEPVRVAGDEMRLPAPFSDKETPFLKDKVAELVKGFLTQRTLTLVEESKDGKILPGMTLTAAFSIDLNVVTGMAEYGGRRVDAKMIGQIDNGHVVWVMDSVTPKAENLDTKDPRLNLVLQEVFALGTHPVRVKVPEKFGVVSALPLDSEPEPVTLARPEAVPESPPAAKPDSPSPEDQVATLALPDAKTSQASSADPDAPISPKPRIAHLGQNSGLVRVLRTFFSTDLGQFKSQLEVLDQFPRVKGEIRRSEPDQLMDFFYQYEGLENYSALLKFVGPLHARLKKQFRVVGDSETLRFEDVKSENPDTIATLRLKPGTEATLMEGVFTHLLKLGAPVRVTLPLKIDPEKPTYLGIEFDSKNFTDIRLALRYLSTKYPQILMEGEMPFSQPLGIPGVGIMENIEFADASATPLSRRKALLLQAFTEVSAKHPDGEFNLGMLLHSARGRFEQAGFSVVFPGFRKESLEGSHKDMVAEVEK